MPSRTRPQESHTPQVDLKFSIPAGKDNLPRSPSRPSAPVQRGIRGGGPVLVLGRRIKQVPAQEGQLGLDGLLVSAEERLVVPAGHPDELSLGSAVRRAGSWPGKR